MAHSPNSSSPDLEAADLTKTKSRPNGKLSHWRMLVDQGILSNEMETHHYKGSGTEDDPFAVTWLDNDPRNPMTWPSHYRWMIVLAMALSVLGVSLNSSMYSGGVAELDAQYGASQEVGTLGLSLFVLGFAIGPLFWAPLSEMFGRQLLFFITYGVFTAFNAGVCGSQNIWTVIILRFFAGSFGSSPLTNAGGVIADCFPARDRGLATSIFAAAPFLGPALGPIIGGFLGEAAGWRWVMGFMAAFSGLALIVGVLGVPETYAPVLLRQRAKALSKLTGKHYESQLDIDRGKTTLPEVLKTSLTRPWVLLFREPIVMIMSIYMAIIYGTLYMLFSAFPIVYQEGRGWSQGIGGLAFIGVLIGMIGAVAYSIWIENPRYQKVVDAHDGVAPPEARLPPAILGGILLPIGLFWFAWTNSPTLPWAASIAAGIPFGLGMVLVFLSIMNYLIDSYTIFAASVLAANAVLRSTFGAVFPLFTTQMYNGLGTHWASSVPGFLALACVPAPFIFYKYGAAIRARCKFAAEAEAFMTKMRGDAADHEAEMRAEKEPEALTEEEENEELWAEKQRQKELQAGNGGEDGARFERIQTGRSGRSLRQTQSRASQRQWDDNPYTMDRVNTRESFHTRKSSSRR
ncbi:MFS general substrate transporter [Microthyrium microscopicum]|uniref:MFS general substrate transporter n=1 Tax=Microthyrium microscopicum TaxID=703497 RepID=A0A6A6U8Z6_9PEZI|nr:MFS general substrate transporter [Microthyrium microscopicum]